MKNKRTAALLCLATTICLALAGCAKSSMDLVVGRVGAENVAARDVTLYANYTLLSYGYSRGDMTAEDIAGLNESAFDSAIQYKLICQKAAALGLYPLSADGQKKVDDDFSQYMANIQASGGNLASAGMTGDDIKTLMTVFAATDALKAETTKDVAATDEEIQAEYDRLLGEQQSSYASNPSAYDNALSGGTTTVVYRPEGYRYVKHILIAMPADIAAQIATATSGGDAEAVASLRKQGLEQIQVKAGDVLAQVQNGGDFDALIAQYGEDPGMTAEPAKTTGYQVGAKSSFVPEFLAAALGLAKAGDTTGLVATDYGYHIIRYAGAVPAGAIPLDEVKDGIRASVLSTKRTDAFDALVEQWKKETAIKKNLAKMPS